ncbi:hypothetical protein [Mesorhizobium sp. IMUNJ 23232]|uniref:hypothetical protein n=1 Tax=Mesorhizobium sp. IMUNJ 23232 TaxID=3376064 RepID=UPI00378E2E23
MTRANRFLLGTISALAIAALPLNLGQSGSGGFGLAVAQAKGGNGGGNGGGHGGNGGGNGKGGGGEHGKSSDARGHAGSSKASRAAARSANGTVRADFGKQKSHMKSASAKALSARSTKAKTATLPASVALPDAKPQNFHAKLAGLNSLKRNYNAYLNSKSPRMAAISAFVRASAELDIARERETKAAAALAEARAEFAAAAEEAALTPYDGAVGAYDDPTVESLRERLADLNAATVADEDLSDWQAEVDAVESLLDSAEADAVADAEAARAAAERDVETASVGTDDEALREALLSAANDNRVAQYGEDDYVDDEMMDWAKDLLGVGPAVGKIDEVRNTLDTE